MISLRNKKIHPYLILIIILSIIIRLPGIWLMPVDDEAAWVIATNGNIPDYQAIPHPPLSVLLYTAFQFIIGHSYISLRAVAVLFGVLTTILTFYMAREIYDDRITKMSAVIMAVLFYSVLGSLQIDMDGSILLFLTSSTLFAYLLYLKEDKSYWLIISGLLFGLSLLTKYPAFVTVFILLLYTFVYNRNKLTSLISFVLIGGTIALLFPFVSYMSGNWNIFTNTLVWGQKNVGGGGGASAILKSVFVHIYRLVQYGTPLLLIFPIISYYKRSKKEEYMLYSWVAVYLLFYVFLVPDGNIPRYFMILIPPLVILSSRAAHLLYGSFDKKSIFTIMGVTLIFFVMISLQNGIVGTIEPFTFERGNFNILSENPDIWYYSSSGPLFRVSAFSFIFVIFGSVLIFIGYFFCKNQRKKMLILFISLNLAFNFFMVEELLFHRYSPDYNVVMKNMISYYNESGLQEPLYSVNEDFAYFLTNGSFYDLDSKNNRLTLGKEGGTALLLNLPKTMSLTDDSYISNSIIRTVDEKCVLLKIFYLGEYDAGYIYRC